MKLITFLRLLITELTGQGGEILNRPNQEYGSDNGSHNEAGHKVEDGVVVNLLRLHLTWLFFY